jgi:hypothetical protein
MGRGRGLVRKMSAAVLFKRPELRRPKQKRKPYENKFWNDRHVGKMVADKPKAQEYVVHARERPLGGEN